MFWKIAMSGTLLDAQLVCEVEFAEWTARRGELRHPSFKGPRWDKVPADVVREG